MITRIKQPNVSCGYYYFSGFWLWHHTTMIIVIHYKIHRKIVFFFLCVSQTLIFKADSSLKSIISDTVSGIPTCLMGHMEGNSLCRSVYKQCCNLRVLRISHVGSVGWGGSGEKWGWRESQGQGEEGPPELEPNLQGGVKGLELGVWCHLAQSLSLGTTLSGFGSECCRLLTRILRKLLNLSFLQL